MVDVRAVVIGDMSAYAVKISAKTRTVIRLIMRLDRNFIFHLS